MSLVMEGEPKKLRMIGDWVLILEHKEKDVSGLELQSANTVSHWQGKGKVVGVGDRVDKSLLGKLVVFNKNTGQFVIKKAINGKHYCFTKPSQIWGVL